MDRRCPNSSCPAQIEERLKHYARRSALDIEGLGDALVHQMVGNLVLNGAQAAGPGGRVEVRVLAADGRAVIEVHDSGPGVPVERRADLFTSLTTTKPDGNGLGLLSVRACASALGGAVEVGDSPLGGAVFRVQLPLALPAPQRAGSSMPL